MITQTWEVFKQNLKDCISLRFWQAAGVVGIVLAYILFVKEQAWWGWAALILVGFIELIAIFVYDSNITRFWRNMYGRPVDMVFLFGFLPLTWWLAGELAAGFFLIGWISSHIHEKD